MKVLEKRNLVKLEKEYIKIKAKNILISVVAFCILLSGLAFIGSGSSSDAEQKDVYITTLGDDKVDQNIIFKSKEDLYKFILRNNLEKEKDQFETTINYNKRIKGEFEKKSNGKFSTGKIFAFPFPDLIVKGPSERVFSPFYYSYDADKQIISLSFYLYRNDLGHFYSNSHAEETMRPISTGHPSAFLVNNYIDQQGMVSVKEGYKSKAYEWKIKAGPSDAERVLKNPRALIISKLSPPFYKVETYFSDSYPYSSYEENYIVIDVLGVVIYDSEGMNVIAKFPQDLNVSNVDHSKYN